MSSSKKDILTCYVFKSRLHEYAQKAGLPTPVYYTRKEGPSHDPSYYSTVEIDGVRHDSLPGFSTHKAAEQSASEVAITTLIKSGKFHHSYQPVHEMGLSKNILQEYAQKMNYAMPAYHCEKHGTTRPTSTYSCTLDIGGVRYIGAMAKTKKEAELKAARTAILTIQSTGGGGGALKSCVSGDTQLTVVPCKRKAAEPIINAPKEKRKKGWSKRSDRLHKRREKMNEGEGVEGANGGPGPETCKGKTGIAEHDNSERVQTEGWSSRVGEGQTGEGKRGNSEDIGERVQTGMEEHCSEKVEANSRGAQGEMDVDT